MALLKIIVVAVVLFGAAAVATGRGDRLAMSPADGREPSLPPGRIGAADVQALQFAVAVRGYRMSQVDAVLSRLAGELQRRHDELQQREEELQQREDGCQRRENELAGLRPAAIPTSGPTPASPVQAANPAAH